jgi:citrate lyase subunit beta/citryl-CoA lyase
MRSARDSGADGLILDLEDAVPEAERPRARDCIREFLAEGDPGLPVFVRVNSLESERFLADLEAVVWPRLGGIVVPKVSSASDVVVVDRTLGWLEERNGLRHGSVRVTPLLETATGMRSAYAIGCASPRVAYMGGLGVKGGDVERALGYRWSKGGLETLALRAQILLDARAAGVPHPLTGVWTDIADLDGLRAFAEQGRDLGYEGMTAIHPSHIATINEVFSVSSEEVDYCRRLIAALEEGAAAGRAAIRFEGELIDTAMVRTAQERLALAQADRA